MIDIIGIGLLVALILTSWSPTSGKLLVGPHDVVVALGQTVQLKCSTDDKYSVNWWHVPVGSTMNEDVFISSVVVLPYHPRFKVQRNEVESPIRVYNLVITSVRAEDAGKYVCLDRAGHGEQRGAQLVILESSSECHSNIDGNGFVGDNGCHMRPDEISCSCSQRYFGNNPPNMEWTNSAGQVIEPQPPVDTSQTNVISSSLTRKPHLAMNGTSIVWRAEQLTSNNWTSAEIKIKYVMKNRTEVNVTEGESILCAANSSEICTYRWTTQNGTTVSEAANLTIVDTGTYFCDATCPLNRGKCTVRSMVAEFRIIHEESDENGTKEMVLIIVGAVAVTVLLSSFVAIFVCLYNQRMKRVEKKKPIPYDEEVQLLSHLRTKDLMVVGVTTLDKMIHVAHHDSNVISEYNTEPPYELTNEIRMDELGEPCDMAACPLNRCLYITDSKNRCVWKLQASSGDSTKLIENISEPFTLSVCSNGNVLMVQQPNRVTVYNVDGSVAEECTVECLPEIKDIQHAVENERGNFIVCHGGKRDKVHAICEVSRIGVLIRSFGSDPGSGARQLKNPRHVAVDDEDRVYVVDAFNERVLQLDSTFQTVHRLPCSARSQPLRLAINDGLILIGRYGAVDVFSTYEMRRSKQNGEYSPVPINQFDH